MTLEQYSLLLPYIIRIYSLPFFWDVLAVFSLLTFIWTVAILCTLNLFSDQCRFYSQQFYLILVLYSKTSSISLIARILSDWITSILSEIPLVTINFLIKLSLCRHVPSWAVWDLSNKRGNFWVLCYPRPFEDYLFPASSFSCRDLETIKFLWPFLISPHTGGINCS